MTGQVQKWVVVLPPRGAARTVAQDFAQALSEFNFIKYEIFDCLKYTQFWQNNLKTEALDLAEDLLNQQLIVKCLEVNADVLFVGALAPIDAFTLGQIQKLKTKTIHWFYENAQEAPYYKAVLPYYDLFLHVQGESFSRECGKNAFHLDTAAQKIAPITPFLNRPYDLGFVGIPTPYRIQVLEFLASFGLKLAIGGLGWNSVQGSLKSYVVNGEWMSVEQNQKLMQQCKMGLNLSQEMPQSHSQLSPRAWDLAAWGVIPILENTPLSQEFLSQFASAAFDHFSQLSDLKSVLQEDWTDALVQNQKRVHEHHLYKHRAKRILEVIVL